MSERLFSLGYSDQVDLTTATSSFTYLQSTFPSISFAREVEDLGLTAAQDFSIEPRKVGSKHGGTLSFTVPLRSQPSAYDPTSDSITVNPEMDLLTELIGNAADTPYSAGQIGGSNDANTWHTTSVDHAVGMASWAGLVSGGVHMMSSLGWIKTLAAHEHTLFEDGIATPPNGNGVYPMRTIYPDSAQVPTPKTFVVKGGHAEHDIRLIGCIPEGATISFSAGDVPTVEFTYRFTDYSLDSSGGLTAATEYMRLPPVLGNRKGRVFLNGTSTGVANTEGTCGVGSFQVTITPELVEVPCHGAAEGVSEMKIIRRDATIGFNVPYNATTTSGTDTIFGNSLSAGTGISISLQVGDRAGQIFALLIPSAIVTAQPSFGVNDSLVGWSVEAQPGAYTADGSSVAPGDTSFRMAFG
tara:strand:+ start:7810 stop:9045 length:1236 start_codon:yes stop_codon:yes gene_type:complete